MVADIVPAPKSKDYYTTVAAKLEEFRDRYPEDNKTFIWTYMMFTNEDLKTIRDSEVGTKNTDIWSGIGLGDLKKLYKNGFRHSAHMDDPLTYDSWNKVHNLSREQQ